MGRAFTPQLGHEAIGRLKINPQNFPLVPTICVGTGELLFVTVNRQL